MFVRRIIGRSRNNQHNAQIYTAALFYMLSPTCFGSSLPSLGSFWIRLSYVKIQIDIVVYHIILMLMVPYILVTYVQFKVQLDVLFMYSLLVLALHVSGFICTHPQEHNCSEQPSCVYGFGMLVHWSRYWLVHPHTFITVNF
jgi:hypothetical protein